MVGKARRGSNRKSAERPEQPGFGATSALLRWYDANARDLPWRMPEGRADPYRVWLSEIMLQQTNVEAVKPYFAKFLRLWPDVHALAAAPDDEILAAWAGLGYYVRARNLVASARIVAGELGGVFPDTEMGLRALPGIGAYTAAAVAAIAFGRRAIVIDGNVERVITRLFAIRTALPQAKPEIRAALAPLVPEDRPGDFAQGLMDLGAGLCTPRNPRCLLCPLQSRCEAARAGTPSEFPVKPVKRARPVKFGVAFVTRDSSGRVLLQTRPARGLLAGMAEVPNSGWGENAPPAAVPPLPARWRALTEPVVHAFTHFELRLEIRIARLSRDPPAPAGMRWVHPGGLHAEPLPTLMKKVIAAAG